MRDLKQLMLEYFSDPELMDRERNEIIDSFIESVPEACRNRVRQYKWIIEGELRKVKDPQEKFERMVELVLEKLHEFEQVLPHCAGREHAITI